VSVNRADPLKPQIAVGFLEYAQARGFVIDPTRARCPTDKARVERTVPFVRDDCFGGETLRTLDEARVRYDRKLWIVEKVRRAAYPSL
jgi:transposase